jgi:hypothetical protein
MMMMIIALRLGANINSAKVYWRKLAFQLSYSVGKCIQDRKNPFVHILIHVLIQKIKKLNLTIEYQENISACP